MPGQGRLAGGTLSGAETGTGSRRRRSFLMAPINAGGPRIRSLVTALPGEPQAQGDLYRAFFADAFAAHPKAESIFAGAQVEHRHFALDVPTFYATERS